jgi:hypothetical protein
LWKVLCRPGEFNALFQSSAHTVIRHYPANLSANVFAVNAMPFIEAFSALLEGAASMFDQQTDIWFSAF